MLGCDSFHDRGKLLIMYMTDVREEMVLYLLVESADKPAHYLIVRSKIACGP